MDITEKYGKQTTGQQYAEAAALLVTLLHTGQFVTDKGGLLRTFDGRQHMHITTPAMLRAVMSDVMPDARCTGDLADQLLVLAQCRAAELEAVRNYVRARDAARKAAPGRAAESLEVNIRSRIKAMRAAAAD